MSLISANKVDTNRVELEISVGAEAFEAAVSKAYRANVKKMNIPGFRKGKAPRHLVEKMFGTEVFYDDAINDLYPSFLQEAIDESDYEYVDDKVDLDVKEVGKDGFTFTAVITVKPEVKIGEYKGFEATKNVDAVTDEDIAGELKTLQDRNSRLVSVEDRAAQNEDTVVFDFDGYVDDVAFEGGKAEKYTLILGSGQFIPGFEEQIVGKKIDEEFDVDVTFPEDYQAEELAGKAAVFKCKLHEIKTREYPELDDEFAKDVSEFDTLDELKTDLSDKLLKTRESTAERDFENQLIEQLIDILDAEIPAAMFENEIENSVRDFSNQLQSQGLNMDMYMQYTGMDSASFREGFREQAEKQVKTRLVLEQIAENEKIEVAAEDIEKEYEKMAEQYKLEVERIKAIIPQDSLAKDMKVGKAMDLVKENAKVVKEVKKAKKAKNTEAEESGEEEEKPAKKTAAKSKTKTAKKAEASEYAE